MFGRSAAPLTEPSTDISVTTIPVEFYAGANPTISFKEVEKVVTAKQAGVVSPAEKKAYDQATATGSGQDLHPVTVASNKKTFIIAGVGLFLVFVAGASGYYWYQARSVATVQRPTPALVVVPTSTVPTAIPTTTPIVVLPVVVPSTTPAVPGSLEFPAPFLTKAPDADNDILTDPEEELFDTAANNPDSDGDSYLDGSEVYHLYSPNGPTPARLIDAGSVVDYTNPAFGYKVYYPKDWALGNAFDDYRDMLFNTITGDAIEIQVLDKAASLTFADWFTANARGERFGDLQPFTTRFNDNGFMRNDRLVYYFVTPSRVYVLTYRVAGTAVANYPNILTMMARSFRYTLQSSQAEVPEQTELRPFTASSTIGL